MWHVADSVLSAITRPTVCYYQSSIRGRTAVRIVPICWLNSYWILILLYTLWWPNYHFCELSILFVWRIPNMYRNIYIHTHVYTHTHTHTHTHILSRSGSFVNRDRGFTSGFSFPFHFLQRWLFSDWETLEESGWGLGYYSFLGRYYLFIESLCFLLRHLLDRTLSGVPGRHWGLGGDCANVGGGSKVNSCFELCCIWNSFWFDSLPGVW